ncbi:alpha-beta hydrolase superfamily lysophospholipase [Isoptericola jiangsuensis]|uniref:Alpha-beta hydrolase superfamily lysophospholipase n=1 Tax=Isoptericola jiangsuensis TaxID=548579 RepID=A0A2A9ESH9_9MICO|nr:alpha/beta hydrolase [Isoptericola jiangsuensis]PFG41516.1 alpha-beta hydrolase superfamily lysophospholipase [Isoptericola jiangsuensis]
MTAQGPGPTAPDTVVLVHGLWMTPRSWEGWVAHYESKGFTVVTPPYPGFEIEVEALRENPQVIADLTVPETVDHLAGVIEALDRPPIIMGHSFGGTLTQLLLARGLGAAGVVIDSAPTEGVRVNPVSQARSLFPALKNPANRHRAVGFTPEEFHYAFTNTLSAEESRAVWDRYAIAAPGFWVWEYGLFANFKPGHQDTWVDYAAPRAPLLFIAGELDHIMPPAVNRSNAKHWERSPSLTEYRELAGRDHWTCAAPGWEEVADLALEWALEHAVSAERASS